MFVDDAFSRFAKVTILLSGQARISFWLGLAIARMARTDDPALRIPDPSVTLGRQSAYVMPMVSAGDLMALYMGLAAAIAGT